MSATVATRQSFVMNEGDQAFYLENGYLLRESAFSDSECAEIARDCEELLDRLQAQKPLKAVQSGSHPINLLADLGVTVKWEREFPDQVRGIEPFAHLSPRLEAWAYDPRLTDPCKFACGAEAVCLFTEKLHTKRARTGGEIEPHQDFPYWEPFGAQASQIVTAMLYLDRATRANGCLEVVPGSHRTGLRPMRSDAGGIDAKRMDPAQFNESELVALETPPGSVLFFNAFLVHRSGHNRSDNDRRSLLYSYQPDGLPHARHIRRKPQ